MAFVLGRLFRCQATYYPTRKEVTTLLTTPFQQIPFELWKPIHVRKGIHNTFKPVFTRYIGVEKQERYDDILATLAESIKTDPGHNLLFDNQIPMSADFAFINAIKYELSQMNMTQLASQDITLFQNPTLNQTFLSACETISTVPMDLKHYGLALAIAALIIPIDMIRKAITNK